MAILYFANFIEPNLQAIMSKGAKFFSSHSRLPKHPISDAKELPKDIFIDDQLPEELIYDVKELPNEIVVGDQLGPIVATKELSNVKVFASIVAMG